MMYFLCRRRSQERLGYYVRRVNDTWFYSSIDNDITDAVPAGALYWESLREPSRNILRGPDYIQVSGEEVIAFARVARNNRDISAGEFFAKKEAPRRMIGVPKNKLP